MRSVLVLSMLMLSFVGVFFSHSASAAATPVPSISFSPSNPGVGQVVTFTGSATGGTSPYTFSWNFGDGVMASGSSVHHIFISLQTFTVTLSVTDSVGASGSVQNAVYVGSLNARVNCTPKIARISDITANQTGTTSFNTSPFSPGITTSVSGGDAKRWLTPGATPSGWNSPGPSCIITNNFGQTISVYVEIDGVKRASTTFEDPSTSYDPTNGGGSYGGGTFNDFTFNIFDPAIVPNYGNSCTSASDPTCYGRIHMEMDHDWQAAGYCGSGTACDPNVFSSQTTDGVTLIDFQGFVYWDPVNLNAADHSFSGWELHPLTGWRIHQAPLTVSVSSSPSSPSSGQTVTFTGTASGGTGSYAFTWDFGDGTTSTGNPATHSYPAGSYSVHLSVTDSNGATGVASKTVTMSSGSAPDFSISSAPSSLTIQAGSSGTSTINLASLNSFSGIVSLSAFVSPSGLTAALSASSVGLSSGGAGSSTLTVSSSTAGSYTVTVTGTSGSLSHSTTVSVTVIQVGDFSISTAPTSLTIQSGPSGTSTISLASLNSFSGTVTLSASGSPSGLAATLSSNSLTLFSGGTGASTLTVSSLTARTYTVTVTGTSGSLSHSTTLTVSVVFPTLASDAAVGPSSIGTSGGEKLIQDSVGKMIAAYVDSSGRVSLSYSNSNPMLNWSPPVKSPTPTSAYARPAAVLVSLTSLRLIAEGGLGSGMVTDIPVTVQRDAQNNITGFVLGTPTVLDSSGLGRYPTAVLAHDGNILLAWAWQNSTRTMVKSLRWDGSTGWTNFAGSSSVPDIVLLDSSSITWFLPNIVERPDNNNVYLLANRLSGPPSTLAYNKASWNGSSWSWGTQNLIYETNSSTGVEDPVGFAWDPVTSLMVVSYGITGTQSFGVFTLNLLDQKTHLDTPSLAITERDWGTVSVHITTGDYYLFLMNVDTDGGSGTLGFIRHPAGGTWNSTIVLLDAATNNQGLNMRATGTSPTLDLLYVSGTSSPATIRFARLSPFNPPNFGVSANPTSVTVHAGSSSTSTITLSSLYSFAGTISLSSTFSPTGLTVSLGPASVTLTAGGTATSTLTVSSTTVGSYTVTVQGTSGSLSHSATVAVKVVDFTISANPSSLRVVVGIPSTLTISLSSVSGFSGTVAITSVVSSPTGLSASVNPAVVTLNSGGTGTSSLTLTSSAAGTYTVTVIGTSGSVPHSVQITVNIIDFSINAGSSTVTFSVGSSGTSTITLTSLNSFSGTLTLSKTVSPATGLTATCAPTSLTLIAGGSATATCSFSSSTTGSYAVTVTATNGTLTHAVVITVNVADFSLTSSPSSLTILAGSPGSSILTLTSLSSFSGTVSFSISASPGLATSVSPTSIGLVSGGTAVSTLTMSSASIGNYTITIAATSGSLTHSIQVTIRVVDFSVSTDSVSPSIFEGQAGTSTIVSSSLGGFAGTIAFTASVSPSGPTASLNLASVSLASSGSENSTLSFNATTGGTYIITVTGTSGSVSHSIQITVSVADYTISANPPAVNFLSGSNSSSTITLTSLGGFSGTVGLSMSITPSTGLTGSCSPTGVSLTSGGSTTSMCSFSSTTQSTYTVTITGTSNPLSRTLMLTVGVSDFAISSNPVTLTIQAGTAGTSSIDLSSLGGFTGAIALSATATPNTLTASLNPASVNLSPGGTASSTLTVGSGTVGAFTVTVTGRIGSLSHSVTVTVNVVDFSVSSSSSSLTMLAGSSGLSSIQLGSLNGFAATVTLSTSVVPSGLGASVSVSSVALSSGGSGSSTLTVTSSLAGNYTVTVTATSASLIHTVQITVQVIDFSISASPISLIIPGGTASNSSIMLTSLNGLSGSLSLTATISPSGPTPSLNPSTFVLSAGGTGSSVLTVSSPSNVSPGVYTVTITATIGILSHSVTVKVNIPDFSISSISASSLTISSGSSGTAAINLTSLNSFSGIVSLSTSVSSPGLTASLGPTSVSLSSGGSGSSSLTISSSAPSIYVVTVTGNSGSLSHSVVVTVTVTVAAPKPVVVASDSAVGPSSVATSGGEKLIQDSAGRMIAVYVDSSGRIALAYANSDPTLVGWSTPVKSPTPATAYVWPAAVLVSPTSLRVIAGGGSGSGMITDIPVTIQRDSQNNIAGFIFGTPIVLDSSGLGRYPTAVLAHNEDILLAWGWANSTRSLVKSLRWDLSTGWTNLAGSSSTPDIVLLDSASLTYFAPNMIERPDNNNVYLMANRFPGPPSTISFNKASWNGSGWSWGAQNLTYESNASDADDDLVSLAWDPVASMVVAAYGITGTTTYGVFTLNAQDVKTHIDTPSLAVTGDRGWGGIGVHITTGDYYIFFITVNTDGGSGTLGYIRHPAGGAWNSTIVLLDAATNNQGLNMRATGTSPTLDFLYASGTSAPAVIKFARLSPFNPPNPPNFSVSAPSSVTVIQGVSTTSTITLASLNGFAGTVALTVSVSPSGLTASLSPTIVTLAVGGTGASTLNLSSSTVGTYTVTVTGTSGSLSRVSTISVSVIAPPNFSIVASPSTVAFPVGSSGASTVTLMSLNGFTGSLTLSRSVTPSTGFTASCSPTSVTLSSGGSATSSCSFSSSTTGIYSVVVSATNGTLTHSATITINVSEFSMSANPASTTVLANTSGTSTITLTSLNGFSGTVSLALSSPAGITASLSQNSPVLSSGGTATSTLTFSSATIGNYTLTITGTSGSLTHSIQVTVKVVDFSISSSSTSLTIFAGQSGTSAITLNSLGDFTGAVALTTSVSSLGLTASTSPTSVSLASGGSGSSTLSASSSTGGTYNVTVTGTIGSVSHSVQITVNVQDYSISANPSTVGFQSGSNSSSTITLASLGGFSGTVALSQSVTPSTGLTVFCSPASIPLISGGSSTSICTFTSSTQGTYAVTITATSGPLSHTTTITVGVGDFTISASPTTLTVQAGSSGTSSITLTSLAGFAGTVNLSTSVIPGGLTASVNPASVNLSPGGTGTSTLTVSSSTVGTYIVTVTGTIGSLSTPVQVTVNVVDFSVSSSSSSLTILAGSSGTSSIQLGSLNGFAGTVALSASASPSSPSASLSPSSMALSSGGSGSSTLTITGSLAGNYTITVIATSGSLAHSVQVIVQVVDFTVSATPGSVSVPAGSSSTSNVVLTSVNGLSGSLSLAATVSPSGPSASLNPSSIVLSANGSASSVLTVSSPGNASPGVYTVTITVSTGTLSHSVTVTVNVPDFSINANPTGITLTAGSSATSTITLASLGRFAGTVALTVAVSSGNLTASISPGSVALTAGGSGSSTLTLSSTTPGSYTVTVTGISGSLTHSGTITVNVVAKSQYALVTTFQGQVYKYQNGTLTLIGQPVTSALRQIAWKPDGSYALIVGDSAVLIKWNGTQLTQIPTGIPTGIDLNTIAWKPDGSYALMGGTSGFVLKYDGISITRITNPNTHQVRGISWRPEGSSALVVGSIGSLLLYQNGVLTQLSSGTTNSIYTVAWNPNGLYAIAGGDNGTIIRYDGTTSVILSTTGLYPSTQIVRFVSWNPTGSLALLVGDAGLVLTYDGTSLVRLSTITTNGLFSVAWSGGTATIVGSNGTTLSYSGGVLTALATNTTSSFRGIAWKP